MRARDADHAKFVARLKSGLTKVAAGAGEEMTPPRMTSRLQAFCSGVHPEAPMFIGRDVDIDAPRSPPDAVARRISSFGGSAMHGWMVRCVPGLWAVARYRVVWVTADGRVLDVSPVTPDEDQLLFIPDSGRSPVFNFADRPLPLYERMLVGKIEMAKLDALLPKLLPEETLLLASDARAKGLTIAQLIRASLNRNDSISKRIDEYLAEAAALDVISSARSKKNELQDTVHNERFAVRERALLKVRRKMVGWMNRELQRAIDDGRAALTDPATDCGS